MNTDRPTFLERSLLTTAAPIGAVAPVSTNRAPPRAAAERTSESAPVLRVPRRQPLTARVGLTGVVLRA